MQDLLAAAIQRRRPLLERAVAEGTDALRLLHGVAEGAPGLTVDRYGPILLVQTWRDPLPDGVLPRLEEVAAEALGTGLTAVWNHRPASAREYARLHAVELPQAVVATELGLRFDARPRHRGNDPLLFLDLRTLRRRVIAHGARTVLNLFSYTCGVGTAALRGGADQVWNVDFAASALDVGLANAALNDLPTDRVRQVHHDALPILRMLAGAKPGRRRPTIEVEPRTFELVVLDPPAFSKGPWGAVDVVRDYPTLLKPALACTAEGGVLAVTQHVASVSLEDFLATLRRTAEKLGRRVAIDVMEPEEDFPSFDGRPPLKIAWVRA
ncbi:MAG: class I SAM-dependent methyltransferase [Alphaproteobacteria bacterium]|nr:class I SAM-dependent methyltransferase [Alphaproteobacteria bacterium]MCB9697362.1 class I SAM-dependent methyltransferase [Alphaproteobacteria bacterium]